MTENEAVAEFIMKYSAGFNSDDLAEYLAGQYTLYGNCVNTRALAELATTLRREAGADDWAAEAEETLIDRLGDLAADTYGDVVDSIYFNMDVWIDDCLARYALVMIDGTEYYVRER